MATKIKEETYARSEKRGGRFWQDEFLVREFWLDVGDGTAKIVVRAGPSGSDEAGKSWINCLRAGLKAENFCSYRRAHCSNMKSVFNVRYLTPKLKRMGMSFVRPKSAFSRTSSDVPKT